MFKAEGLNVFPSIPGIRQGYLQSLLLFDFVMKIIDNKLIVKSHLGKKQKTEFILHRKSWASHIQTETHIHC